MIIALAKATTIYVSLPTEDNIFDKVLHLFSIREDSKNTIIVPDIAPMVNGIMGVILFHAISKR